ncbi:MAG: hypothetical protein PHC41_15165 [Lachnospiraceae bacterium]|nr:hypothetical protein [Lachnospiraceae bacterium]MDD3617543.1 hypothetical protein [Lachnospiraceae bacterium]
MKKETMGAMIASKRKEMGEGLILSGCEFSAKISRGFWNVGG